jgi:uncharacterized membrane protein YoaK (UPF0700 family)
MFRHRGKRRTPIHNLKIASLLSFVAGMVNIAGFWAVQRLTTNVTGHFAFFIDELFKFNLIEGFTYFLFIFFFFLGSFLSNILVEIIAKKNERLVYVAPLLIESSLLFFVGFLGEEFIQKTPNTIAFLLLFAMGLQNSLVTTLSNASVRTTHLTGLFTDLGIELSQLFFYKNEEQKNQLYTSIKLRITIISFFFLGGIIGGFSYLIIQLHVLIIAGILLLVGLIYDDIKLKLMRH